MQRQYWSRVHKRALAATRKFLGLESRGQIMLRLIGAVAVIAALALWGSQDAARDELIFRGVRIGVVIAAFPLLYAWNFIKAPAEINLEQIADIENLNIEIKELKSQKLLDLTIETYVKVLAILIERGVSLNAKRITQEQFDKQRIDVREWERLSLKVLATAFSHQDAISFNTVRYNIKEGFTFSISNDHNDELQKLTARLGILREIIDRHKDKWSPLSGNERAEIENALDVIQSQIVASDGDQALDEKSG